SWCHAICFCCLPQSATFPSTCPRPTGPHPLSLHDALPIYVRVGHRQAPKTRTPIRERGLGFCLWCGFNCPVLLNFPRQFSRRPQDRKSTRLNSSHVKISYAVCCLKKKNKTTTL